MLPIVVQAPVVQSNKIDGPGSHYMRQVRSKQKKPYNLPAPYNIRRLHVASAWLLGSQTNYSGMLDVAVDRDPKWGVSPNQTWSLFADVRVQGDNSAYGEFMKKLKSAEAMLAVNYAERAQALDMMQRRALQLYRFTRAIARRDLVGAAKELGVKPKQTMRKRARSAADNFLEFHFGWSPLVADIYACVDLLQGPVPWGLIQGKGRKIPISTKLSGGSQWAIYKGYERSFCGAVVAVTNPNLFLANSLGLVNPASVLWELVPFSFLLDWFVNVGDFLTSMTDLWGVSISNAYTSQLLSIKSCETDYRYTYGGKLYGFASVQTGVWFDRRIGLPSVTLAMRPPWRLSPSRAATAISLLIQNGLRKI